LVDFSEVYQFMLDNYSVDWRRGTAAPFFEYAQVLYWTEKTQNHRNAIWEDNGQVTAFCWYSNAIGEAYFNVADGYEFLIPEMIDYAETRLSKADGSLELKLFMSQKAVLEEAQNLGYEKVEEWTEGIYDFSKGPLDYPLPEGFSFEEPGKFDMKKMIEASWRGFDHDTEPDGGVERGYHLIAAPHATPELDVIIKNQEGEYVCYAGMWLVPDNKLAYLEPLCTVPEYRRMGLASAALSELYRRTVVKGATHMTGGVHPFYFSIGYDGILSGSVWRKNND
jgi:GNAT superfamily N-acetyltransferase